MDALFFVISLERIYFILCIALNEIMHCSLLAQSRGRAPFHHQLSSGRTTLFAVLRRRRAYSYIFILGSYIEVLDPETAYQAIA